MYMYISVNVYYNFANRFLYTVKKPSAHHIHHVPKCFSCHKAILAHCALFSMTTYVLLQFAFARFEHFVCRGYIYTGYIQVIYIYIYIYIYI